MESKIIRLDQESREALLNRTLTAVCEAAGVPAHQIKSKTRERKYTDPRHAFFYVIRKEHGLKYSFAELGKYMGHRDHSTVANSLKTSGNLIMVDKAFQQLVTKICERLNTNNLLPMSKEDRFDAIRFLNVRIEELQKWLHDHPENAYREKIQNDLRSLEKEREEFEAQGKINQTNIS